LTDRFHAGKLIKAMAAEVGGGGGGRPDMAQAGGTQPEHLDKALAKAEELIKAVTSDE
jgi:alanyl-tRNA synthetase